MDAGAAFAQALLDDDAEALYDRAPCGYLSTDPGGLIVKVNQTFLTTTGYRREDLVGRRRFAELLSVGGRIYHDTHYAPMLLMQDSAREIALDLVGADGARIPVLVTSLLERDARGAPLVIRTAVFDASERRRYELELLRATRRAEESEAHARQLAATLQASLIPPVAPAIPGLDIASVYHPAGAGHQIGGDFFDVYPTGRDEWIVALGDVSGKGIEAAIVTALIRHTLRAATIQNPAPAQALTVVNDVLYRDETDRFCTVALVRLNRTDRGWLAEVSLGGHPAPLLCRPGRPSSPVGQPGTIVGALARTTFHTVAFELAPGDTLLLYTDGVTEARHDGAFYEDTRLQAVVDDVRGGTGTSAAGALVGRILEDVLDFQRGSPTDDIALLALGVPPEDPGAR